LEGEGNRTAAREYNEATRKFIQSGRVDASAKDAERALDSPERKDLEAAEKEGLRHVAEEDPAVDRRR
jgi:hypothetical protein